MKRGGFKKLSYEETVARLEAKRAKKANESVRLPSKAALEGKRRSKQRKATNGRRHKIWQKEVRERDNYTCRWPGCSFQSKYIDVHHINERSQRPDLRYDTQNGACICGLGTKSNHHDRLHHTVEGREEGKKLGLLGGETYEAARKEEANYG